MGLFAIGVAFYFEPRHTTHRSARKDMVVFFLTTTVAGHTGRFLSHLNKVPRDEAMKSEGKTKSEASEEDIRESNSLTLMTLLSPKV